MQNILESPSKRSIIKMKIEKKWNSARGIFPSDEDISQAKWLGKNETGLFYLIENTIIIILLETRGILDTGVIESLAQRVKKKISSFPTLPVITCAASLAHHRLLGSVEEMRLCDVDLTSVPAEHLASLVSGVTGTVTIYRVSGCNLVTILDSVRSRVMSICTQRLGSEETQALVRAMESGVEIVKLDYTVKLDIRILMEYSGQGKCRKMEYYCICTKDRYRRKLRTWATNRNWKVTSNDDDICFTIKRI